MVHTLANRFPAGGITKNPCNKLLSSVYKFLETSRSKNLSMYEILFKGSPEESTDFTAELLSYCYQLFKMT